MIKEMNDKLKAKKSGEYKKGKSGKNNTLNTDQGSSKKINMDTRYLCNDELRKI